MEFCLRITAKDLAMILALTALITDALCFPSAIFPIVCFHLRIPRDGSNSCRVRYTFTSLLANEEVRVFPRMEIPEYVQMGRPHNKRQNFLGLSNL